MLTPSASPSLLLELRQLLETDYAVPDLWDPDKQVLLDNDAYLHAQVEAIKAGTALAPGSVTDVAIGTRGILDTHTAPGSGAYDDTLTNHLRTLATRIKALMGTASWASAIPTTLTGAKAHADDISGGVHGAVSAATPDAIVRRDASGRARFGAPTDADHAARKDEVDAVSAGLASHTHDDRYYTKTVLAASGSYGSNAVHADRVSIGTLQAARIPALDASKIGSGEFALARIPTITAPKTAFLPQLTATTARFVFLHFITGSASFDSQIGAPTGWALVDMGGGRSRVTHTINHRNYFVFATPLAGVNAENTQYNQTTYHVARQSTYFDVTTHLQTATQSSEFPMPVDVLVVIQT